MESLESLRIQRMKVIRLVSRKLMKLISGKKRSLTESECVVIILTPSFHFVQGVTRLRRSIEK